MNYLIVDKMIREALIEDIPNEDISTNSVVGEESRSTVDLICKADGVIAGLGVYKRVFDILGDVEIEFYVKDGDKVQNKQLLAKLTGSTRNLLMGERVALNYLQRMSGIATMTNKFVEKHLKAGTKYRVGIIDEKYLNSLLNYEAK